MLFSTQRLLTVTPETLAACCLSLLDIYSVILISEEGPGRHEVLWQQHPRENSLRSWLTVRAHSHAEASFSSATEGLTPGSCFFSRESSAPQVSTPFHLFPLLLK